MMENSIPIEFHHVQDTLNLLVNQEYLALRTIVLSEKKSQSFFPRDQQYLGKYTFRINLPRDHKLDLEDLAIVYNQIPQEIMTITLKAFQSQQTNMKLICLPLEWHLLSLQQACFKICIFLLRMKLRSRLEITFVLDRGASISLLDIPTYNMSNQTFNICIHDQHETSKMLAIANQFEVPIRKFIFATCFSSVETKSRYFMVPFVVTDFLNIILRKPFFEKYIQTINLEDCNINFKYSFIGRPTFVCFITLIKRNFPSFSFIYQSNSKQTKANKHSTVQTLHFLLKTSKVFMPKTENHEALFPKCLKLKTETIIFLHEGLIERFWKFVLKINLKKFFAHS